MPEEKEKSEPSVKKPPSMIIPLIKVPNEGELLEEELEQIYDEDKVTHKHGNSEPESD